MENNMNARHGENCNCPACTWSHVKTHSLTYHIFKKIFLLIVIFFVFWIGMRLGELRTLESQMRMGAWQNAPMHSATGQIYQ